MNHKLVKVLLDGQAWLYANQLKLQRKSEGMEVTHDQFREWEAEWKRTTADLIMMEEQESNEQ